MTTRNRTWDVKYQCWNTNVDGVEVTVWDDGDIVFDIANFVCGMTINAEAMSAFMVEAQAYIESRNKFVAARQAEDAEWERE